LSRALAVATCFAVAVTLGVACSGDDDDGDPAAAAGEQVYRASCATCHAVDGSGAVGPAIGDGLAAEQYSARELATLVRDGIGAMPSLRDELTDAEIDAVVAYVREELRSARGSASTAATNGDRSAVRGIPPEVVEYADDWPLPNRDYANSRATFDSAIDSTTVADLEVAWRYDMPGGGLFGNAATTPLIVGDTVYAGDLETATHAVDRETGARRWTAGGGGGTFGPSGVAVGWDKVFGVKAGPRGRGEMIAAYDAADGRELWASDISGNGGEVNIQPSAYDGLVLAATSALAQAGARGTISALDVETGGVVWTFDTIESPDLWGHPELNSGGGAWYPPAVDPDARLAYFGTSNPYPFPGTGGYPNGASRPGDNRWTQSTVALDLETGALAWGYQAFPHDLFDRDHVLASLAVVEIDGARRRIVVTTGKGGVVVALDAATGEELWKTPVGRHENDDVTELTGPLEVFPGAQGGVLTPIAVADGTVYVAAINAPITYSGPEESSVGFGTRLGTNPGNLVAIDIATGAIRWDVGIDGDALGGMTVVNDLVFTSTLSGRIVALDRDTGAEVWEHQADGGINGWPAIAGDLMVVPVGRGEPPHLLALRLR
jgi:outer membrane protein assembly factor BamB/mono/diheme cytochrome c family protein